ncbi:MAG: sodium:proton antiporter [Gammaproteobacteria bacterium]|nr:sodium:proton antiporter [Gammaproteobacteria bacterium]
MTTSRSASLRVVLTVLVAGCGVALLIWWLRPLNVQGHYGAWSLLPAAVTITICFLSRNVILALLMGIFAGGLLIGRLNIIDAFLIPSLGSAQYAQILLVYLWALGGLLGMWNKNGGARYFAESMANRFVRSRVSAKVFAWIMGVVFHQGGTISTVLTGTTVRPISDQHRVGHEELAYVVDSTASPIATLIPFNVWPIYVAGLITIEPLAHVMTSEAVAVSYFLQAIPFNFYAWIAVLMTLLFALDRLPLLGTPMQRVIARMGTTGELDAPGAEPMLSRELTEATVDPGYRRSMIDFLAPIGVLLGLCIVPWLLGGEPMVFEGFGLAVVTAVGVSVVRGMSLRTAFDAVLTGIKGVTVGAIVLGLAVTLATVSEQVGTSNFVVEASTPWLQNAPYVLPSLMLLICMVVAFSIGSSWGTYAVVFPVALPLAIALSSDPTFLLLTFGAILGGAVFGDQCSPISDTTILSALACGSDLMDHVNTQLPLAGIAAGIAAVLYLVLGLIVV